MLLRVRILVLCACVPLNRNAAGKYCFYVCECVNDAVFSGRTVCLEGWWWCGWLIWIMVWWWWCECGLVLSENCDGCSIVLKKLWLFEFFMILFLYEVSISIIIQSIHFDIKVITISLKNISIKIRVCFKIYSLWLKNWLFLLFLFWLWLEWF